MCIRDRCENDFIKLYFHFFSILLDRLDEKPYGQAIGHYRFARCPGRAPQYGLIPSNSRELKKHAGLNFFYPHAPIVLTYWKSGRYDDEYETELQVAAVRPCERGAFGRVPALGWLRTCTYRRFL